MDLKILSHNIAQDQTGYDSIDALIIKTNAEIDLPKKRMVVYNIHTTFPWIRMGRDPWISCIPWLLYDDKTRRKEIADLMIQLQNEKVPFIIAGDFNLSSFSKDYKILTSAL